MVTYTFTNGTVADANQVNKNFTDVEALAAKGLAQVQYNILDSSGVLSNGNGVAADKFTTESGVNGTVNQISPNYALTDTTIVQSVSPSGTISDEINAFDNNLETYAEYSISINDNRTSTLGKTFTERLVEKVYYKCSATRGEYTGSIQIKIQTYNGSVWSDFSTVYNTSTTSSGIQEGLVDLNTTCQGVRLSIYTAGTSLTLVSHKFYELSYGDLGTTALFSTDKYVLGPGIFNTDGALYDPQTFTNTDNAFDGNPSTYAEKLQSVSGTLTTYLGKTFTEQFVSHIKLKASGTLGAGSGTETVTIYLYTYNGTSWILHSTLVTQNFNNGGTTTYDDIIFINSIIQGIAVRIDTINASTLSRSHKVYLLEKSQYSTESNIITNTVLLDNTESISGLYLKGDIPTDTDIKADITDGVNIIMDVEFDSKGKVVTDVSSLGSGTMQIKWKLSTLDPAKTPSFYGYGVYVK